MIKLNVDIESVMESDREFFEHHPHQKSYIRDIHPLEIIEAHQKGVFFDLTYRVVVTEIAPGVRSRQMCLPEELANIQALISSERTKYPAGNNRKPKGFARDNRKSKSE